MQAPSPHLLLAASALVGLAASVLTGCAGGKGGEDSSDPTSLRIADIEITRSELIPTVTTVTWSTSDPALGRVRFGEAGGELSLVSADSPALATEHRAVLLGLYEGADGSLVVEAWNDQEEASSDPLSFSVGLLGAEIPRPVVLGGDPEQSVGGFFLIPTAAVFARYVSIADAQGRMVWAYGGSELETQRARFTKDGTGLVFMNRDITQTYMELVRMDWDGTERWRLDVPEGHRDFDLVDDETFIALAYDDRVWDEGGEDIEFRADKIIELTTQGEVSTVWTLYDHLQVEDPAAITGGGSDMVHWSHSNYLHYLPEDDRIQVTSRALNLAWNINRSDGSVDWLLNDARGDFTNGGSLQLMSWPHSVWPVEGGVLVFNQGIPELGGCSTASRIGLDLVDWVATASWLYESDPCYQTDYLGNAQPLAGDHALVSFGKVGVMDEVDLASGELVMRWGLNTNEEFLYVEHSPTLGLPEN